MQEFNKIGKKLPYKIEHMQLDRLKERCKNSITQREPTPISPWAMRALALTACIAIGVVVITPTKSDIPSDPFETLIENIDDATLEQLANNDYDDIALTIF